MRSFRLRKGKVIVQKSTMRLQDSSIESNDRFVSIIVRSRVTPISADCHVYFMNSNGFLGISGVARQIL